MKRCVDGVANDITDLYTTEHCMEVIDSKLVQPNIASATETTNTNDTAACSHS